MMSRTFQNRGDGRCTVCGRRLGRGQRKWRRYSFIYIGWVAGVGWGMGNRTGVDVASSTQEQSVAQFVGWATEMAQVQLHLHKDGRWRRSGVGQQKWCRCSFVYIRVWVKTIVVAAIKSIMGVCMLASGYGLRNSSDVPSESPQSFRGCQRVSDSLKYASEDVREHQGVAGSLTSLRALCLRRHKKGYRGAGLSRVGLQIGTEQGHDLGRLL